MRISLSLITVILIAGCSNEQIYNSMQENQRMECGKLPGAQYEECMREFNTSYKEYERER
jgi:hypothetical protein